MSVLAAVGLFIGCFALSIVSSIVLSRRLEQLGAWLRMSQSLLGIVAALGADAPEISSAAAAMHAGRHDLGAGIVLGSNIFNLAALLGLSALVAGGVRVTRQTLLLNGGVAMAVMLAVAAQLYGGLAAGWAIVLIAVIMAPYIAATAIPRRIIWRYVSHFGIAGDVGRTVEAAEKDAKRPEQAPQPSTADALGAIPSLVAIVVASIGMVDAAVVLGQRINLSDAVVGSIILASLTGIPNVITAIALARRGRGSAVLSEALNSNTLNLIAGLSIPAVILGVGAMSQTVAVSLWWMVCMTLLALGLSWFGGLRRAGGIVLIAIYAAFVVMIIVRG